MELTRREFIKTASVLAGVAGAGLGSGERILHALSKAKAPLAEEVKTGVLTCPGNGCHQNCGLRAYVQDGKVVKIDAAPFPDPEVTHACVKGLASGRWLYQPDRLKYPMKRVGERGSGQWERITWEEALDTIASKITAARAQYGPESIWIASGGSSYYNRLGNELGNRLSNLLEGMSPWGWFTSGDNAPPASTGLLFGYTYFMGDSHRDAVNYKTWVLWGYNLAESAPRNMKYLLAAKETGTKIVYIGPVFNKTAAIADSWIPVKHGGDSALALGMMNIIIAKGLYDAQHLKTYTCGPLLVRSDTGLYLRESDINAGGSTENFVVWDSTANAAVAIPPGTGPVPNADPALLGTYTVNGIEAKPAFQLLADRAAEYPVSTAAQLSGVSEATIQEFAMEVATTKSTYHYVGIGPGRQYYGTLETRALFTLAIITGQMGLMRAGTSSAKLKPIKAATDAKAKPVFVGELCQGIKDGTYPVKVYFNSGSNKFWSSPNARITWIEGVLPKLDLFVTYEVFMTWTAQYADIVLPDTTIFESFNLSTPEDHLLLTQPLVEPMYDCKSDIDFWQELAQRLGLGEYFGKTPQEWIGEQLSSGDASIEGITFERLQSEGIVRVNAPPSPLHYLRPATTASKRIEFYNDILLPLGEELPLHKDSPEQEQFGAKYPLTLITTRIMFFMQSIYSNVDFLREIVPEPYLEINPNEAQARGIGDGDTVRVFNDRWAFKVKARISQAVGPGTLNVPYHFWPEDFIEGHPSLVIAPAEENINPIQKVYPTPGNNGSATGCLWDCLVEVEKA
jgi:anaerobic dimethyl sulfoxide reductase subunit A